MPADALPDDIVVIGLDFGTTYSGVAWAYSRDPDEIELVTSWDAELNHCSDVEKAPSQLYYGGRGEPTTWGYSIPPEKNPLKWFKLLLLDERDVPSDVSVSEQLLEARRLQQHVNQDPIDIIGCFLRSIWNHSIDSISRALGPKQLGKCKFHVVITLPAIWPPYAQQRMKQAAKMSGILDTRACGDTTLRFISEPEAAALATLKDLSRRSTLMEGDTLVVCDAGGGTVDLISYVVEQVEPFVVKECVSGDGALCGGVFLDEKFTDLIKSKVQGTSWDNVSDVERKKFQNDYWEHGIKPQYQNQSKTWLVELPPGCQLLGRPMGNKKMKRREALHLSSADILSVFSPIIDKILTLVKKQAVAVHEKYLQPPKYIVLVGGFGRSRYLFERLQDEFAPQTTILQSRGNKPWTAICRGAVVQGLTRNNLASNLQVKVKSRVARASYGVGFSTPFVEGIHLESDKYWDERSQEYRAANQMKWFLTKGEEMSEKEPVRAEYYRHFAGTIPKIRNWIKICPSAAPERNDDTVHELCTITWSRSISLESLPTYINKIGKVYRELNYTIEMTCEEGTVDFTIYHKDQRVGAGNVQVDYA